jgi:Flp pilus assembly protein TadG
MKQSMIQTAGPHFLARHTVLSSRKRKGEAGTGLVEYAFICIIFMTMIFGIIDFSRALYSYHFVSNVAREATRWAAVNGSSCAGDASCNGTAPMNNGPASQSDIQTYVTNHSPLGIDSAKLTTTVTWLSLNGPANCSAANPAPGCTVKVQVSYVFSFVTPLVYNKPLTLSSASEMIIAH